ncbi:rCG28851 [Rattus norvegicus]|uniref:RCG28851 n=1 Tax=Rattus norvegicus TaxID=10116 RepID=A6HW80_RAT|nr:rCG28851 [Rattus norvegicus]
MHSHDMSQGVRMPSHIDNCYAV